MLRDEIQRSVPSSSLVTTYLEMLSHAASSGQRSRVRSEKLRVQELTQRTWQFNRDMYFAVDEKWNWTDKRPWTDDQWRDYASDPNLRTFAGYFDHKVAGYFELYRSADGSLTSRHQRSEVGGQNQDAVEIAYFGLLPEFIGRGLGGALLSSAIENAWNCSPPPSRVWVHTCNRDHSSALANYQARGFRIYKTVTSDS